MCGIVGAIAERHVMPILIEGLKRLEYRGYDSAGLVLVADGRLMREREVGKVVNLEVQGKENPTLHGTLGIAHTRWATHGKPTVDNAHPHISGDIAVVHNGIIENYASLKLELEAEGFIFTSQTDTEVIAHLIARADQSGLYGTLLECVQSVLPLLHGAYGLAVVCARNDQELVAVRSGSPLVIGLGIGENFLASDQLALLPVTNRFIYLDEKDVVHLTRDSIQIYNNGVPVTRECTTLDVKDTQSEKGQFKHFMLKEIYEQPEAISRTLTLGLTQQGLREDFLANGNHALAGIKQVQIIACGTSYHAGMVAKYWFERIIKVPCHVEIASEFRYRSPVVVSNTLMIYISQSGETADTMAALREVAKITTPDDNIVSLCLCNVATSSLVRETQLHLMTMAGPEIGVASTKAFTTQLVALMMLVMKIGQLQGRLSAEKEQYLTEKLWQLPIQINDVFSEDHAILAMSKLFVEKNHALFLGRGVQYPIALEGALKLKEISYIHAEGYAAGELKHGPLALVDNEMPIVVLAPLDDLFDKLKSNMQEVQARGGELFVFADERSDILAEPRQHVVYVPAVDGELAPILYSVPVQLLSYHVAVLRGTDVDQPRNLAKSVTVE